MGPLNLAWAARFPRRGPNFNLTAGVVKNFTIELSWSFCPKSILKSIKFYVICLLIFLPLSDILKTIQEGNKTIERGN